MSGSGGTARVYREVLRHPGLRRVQVAFFLFTAAEYAVWISVALFAYDQGGATAAGIVLLAQLLPAALLAPFAATFGDRMARPRALALGYAVQACACALLGAAMWVAPPLVAYGAAILSSVAVTLTRPVHYAILPELAESPAQLTAANSVSSSLEGLGILVGPLSITPLVLLSGTALVPTVYVGVLAVAALLCAPLVTNREPSAAAEDAALGVIRETFEGARAVLADPPAATLTILGGSQYVVIGLLDVFWAVLAVELLGEGEHVAGLLAGAFGLGGLLGAAATAVLIGRRRLTPSIVSSLAVAGVAIAVVAWAPALAPAALLLAGAGAARSFFDVAARTLLQRSLDREVIARVFGLQEGLVMLGLAIGSALAPVLVGAFGAEGALVAMGVIIPISAVVSFAPLSRLDRRAVLIDDEVRSLLRSIAIFEPLPAFELEDVARLLAPLTAPAGEVLVREGDPGDRFYVVAAGEVVVRSKERDVARIGPGGYFGEIALLRDVPRTATVVAATHVSLLALERDDFLSAVTGGRRVSQVADLEIDRRLGELRADGPGASQDRNSPS